MKIALLTYTFPPKWLSGTEVATCNLAKYLARQGHDVHVITSLDAGLPKIETKDGFQIHRTKFNRVKYIGCIIFWAKIVKMLKAIKPDVVHSQMIGMGMPALVAKKLFGLPYVIWGRGSDVYLTLWYERLFLKPAVKNADAVIALTEQMKEKIGAFYKRDASVIPNGINLDEYAGLSKENLRAELKIEPDDKVIIYIGRLSAVKGVEYLIRAMGLVKEKAPAAKLILIGDGSEKEKVKSIIKQLNLEHLIIQLPQVPNQNIPKYAAVSDLLVLPSLSEGFPMTILEAMASGLPVVATKVSCLTEIVKEGKNCFLVEPANPEQLAEKILLLLKNDGTRAMMSANNKESVKQYSWESVISQLEKIYFKIASGEKTKIFK
jgi:glycosyltransferase involved in cell wall biosynthesis